MFLTIQDGSYTININMISEIDWTEGDEEAMVTMVTGQQYTVDGDEYQKLRDLVGADK